jgi:amidase
MSEPESEPNWVGIGRRKRAQLEASIPPPWRLSESQLAVAESREGCMHVIEESGILSPRELELTEKYDATALAQMIRERKLSSVELTEAFCKV